jgi:hypothetical protein
MCQNHHKALKRIGTSRAEARSRGAFAPRLAAFPEYGITVAGVADRTWFPDEDICRLANIPEWVKRQRKISKKAAPGGYFTLAMLRHDCRIPMP